MKLSRCLGGSVRARLLCAVTSGRRPVGGRWHEVDLQLDRRGLVLSVGGQLLRLPLVNVVSARMSKPGRGSVQTIVSVEFLKPAPQLHATLHLAGPPLLLERIYELLSLNAQAASPVEEDGLRVLALMCLGVRSPELLQFILEKNVPVILRGLQAAGLVDPQGRPSARGVERVRELLSRGLTTNPVGVWG